MNAVAKGAIFAIVVIVILLMTFTLGGSFMPWPEASAIPTSTPTVILDLGQLPTK